MEGSGKYITEEAYFAYEASIEGKAEYHDGQIIARGPETKRHGQIQANLTAQLVMGLKGKPSMVYSSSVKVHIPATNSYVYPDLSVEGGNADADSDNESILRTPILIVEVLSETTATYDVGAKFFSYQRIPTLMEYVLVDQFSPTINVIRRNEEGAWGIKTSSGLEDFIELQSLGLRIPLAAIYNRVLFPSEKRSLI